MIQVQSWNFISKFRNNFGIFNSINYKLGSFMLFFGMRITNLKLSLVLLFTPNYFRMFLSVELAEVSKKFKMGLV